jgi:hypothetical protein
MMYRWRSDSGFPAFLYSKYKRLVFMFLVREMGMVLLDGLASLFFWGRDYRYKEHSEEATLLNAENERETVLKNRIIY